MIALLTAKQMREADARAVAQRGQEALVRAAGFSVALLAREMLGTLFGRRVAVLAGPGLNGADGRVAALVLRNRGCHVDVVDVSNQPGQLAHYDLVIDAAFGLGCSRPYHAPVVVGATPVLAVDLPSGVDADTGRVFGAPLRADVTLALGALKFAHLDGDARALCGAVHFAGLDIVAPEDNGLVADGDLTGFVRQHADDHKWKHAVTILAGSPAMSGAALLASAGALSTGASMLRVESRGGLVATLSLPPEAVRITGGGIDPRSGCVVAGPGLGDDAATWLRERLEDSATPSVFDADALTPAAVSLPRRAARVLTPHDGEFERLSGRLPGSQRIDAARTLARQTECIVLLKGPFTIVAHPDGRVRVVASGTAQLATAGTGDVLAGMIGGAIARGHEPFVGAALCAHLHALAGRTLRPYGSANDLPRAITHVLHTMSASSATQSPHSRPTMVIPARVNHMADALEE